MHSRAFSRLEKERLRGHNMKRKMKIRVASRYSLQLTWDVLPVLVSR